MDKPSISTELTELENRLQSRTDIEPAAAFRDRVLSVVATELAKPAQSPPVPRLDSAWWAAVAAGILIVLNLSMVSASGNEFSIRPMRNAEQQMTTEFQALRQLEAEQEGLLK